MGSGLIDELIPRAEIAERHETLVAAPADLVFEVASGMELRSIPLVAAIFWLREKLLGASPPSGPRPKGIVAETLALGWGRLAERPKRELVMGAVTQPWLADVVFTPVAPERFAAFAEPDLVKIVWTLEAEPIDATHTCFRTETRALPTDDSARRKFERYWRFAGAGIVLIRLLGLSAVRREAERRFRTAPSRSPKLPISTCLASRQERRRAMPADSIVPDAMATVTNAITIDAPPERVWPWLAQLGAGRAGWYSYDLVDNGGLPSANRIVPEHQHLAAGVVLPAIPGATDAFVVASLEPPLDLALTVPGPGGRCRASWEFLLKPQAHDRTRLIVRGRVSPRWLDAAPNDSASSKRPIPIERVYGVLAKMPRPVVFLAAGLGHRLMQARQLRGIKRRAERLT